VEALDVVLAEVGVHLPQVLVDGLVYLAWGGGGYVIDSGAGWV
jgi:hypothetical protein